MLLYNQKLEQRSQPQETNTDEESEEDPKEVAMEEALLGENNENVPAR